MRQAHDRQFKLGEIPISAIELDIKSRDDVPQLLLGLQYIYVHRELRDAVFKILEETISPDVDHQNGRPGMELWKILVMGVLRLDLNWDYDRLQEMVNNHDTIRQMLGHGFMDKHSKYKLQTVKDNVSLLTPEILDKINQVVVRAGHHLVKKKECGTLKGRCDSFVVETDVHYPTDINLLFDAIRKVITLIAGLCSELKISDWRQSEHLLRKVKRLFRRAQKIKRSTSKHSGKQAKRDALIAQTHQTYIEVVERLLTKARTTIEEIHGGDLTVLIRMMEIENYMAHAERQMDQIWRRVIEGKPIPHDEKVFSIFEPHTEWINKGKAGVPVELGLRACVLEDQYGFILHHTVMEKETDDQVAVSMIEATRKRFPELRVCSFDKGFHSPANQQKLREMLDLVVLPKKGRLSAIDKGREFSEAFVEARHQHSAVESAINALEVHGLDRCLDHGIKGFKQYVSLAVLARNIQVLGAILRKKRITSESLRKKPKKAA